MSWRRRLGSPDREAPKSSAPSGVGEDGDQADAPQETLGELGYDDEQSDVEQGFVDHAGEPPVLRRWKSRGILDQGVPGGQTGVEPPSQGGIVSDRRNLRRDRLSPEGSWKQVESRGQMAPQPAIRPAAHHGVVVRSLHPEGDSEVAHQDFQQRHVLHCLLRYQVDAVQQGLPGRHPKGAEGVPCGDRGGPLGVDLDFLANASDLLVVGWHPPSPALSDGPAGESWRLWSPRPGFIWCATTGVLAPRARDRGGIVPAKPVEASAAAIRESSAPSWAHRLGWAALLARVFSAELSECAACGGRLKIIAALTDPAPPRNYLPGVGLPAWGPPRAPPQPLLDFAA